MEHLPYTDWLLGPGICKVAFRLVDPGRPVVHWEGSMKFKLVCTECEEKFTIRGDVAWDGLECPACGFKGNVVGRIVDGNREYFTDEWSESEDVTEVLPVVSDDVVDS